LFCTVEVNFPIYTAGTHGKISQLVPATVFINYNVDTRWTAPT